MTTDVRLLVSDEYDICTLYVDGRLQAASEGGYYDDTVLTRLIELLGGTLERSDDAVMGNEEWNGDREELAQTWDEVLDFRRNGERYRHQREREEALDRAEGLRTTARSYLEQADEIEKEWR